MDLFDQKTDSTHEPLAARMRPRNLDEFIGQEHIVGKGRLLRRAIAADQLTSVIFYGPPGTGKTTLARVIANHTKSNFITLNAVLTGVQSIRDAISQADEQYKLYNRKTILFVDEVHRWNKSQQDALLPWVENGTLILVGATTENPFFEVNKALVSRSRVFQLKPLTKDDLKKAVENTISDKERGYGNWHIQFEQGAMEHLIDTANGDARNLLNALELAVETTPEQWPPAPNETIYITKETAEESIQKKVVLYDKDGDYHYDIISAFIKSLRGRDPDAALYWMARMISAGEDPHFIFRRMIISACEDTGLADPAAIGVVESCAAAFDRIGLPEGRYMLTQAELYLATAPKSNSAMAFFDALKTVQAEDAEVPNHLRDSSRDSEGFGHGAGYLYPHAYRDHWVAQQYLPDALIGRVFYTPGEQGYEKQIREEVLSRRELQVAAILENITDNGDQTNPVGEWWEAEHLKNGETKTGENLTYSPTDKSLESWQKRTEEGRAQTLLAIRNKLMDNAKLVRHSRNLITNADDGLFVWESLRRSPEGFSCGLCKTEQGREILEKYASTLPEIDRPFFATSLNNLPDVCFDNVFFRDPFSTQKTQLDFFHYWMNELKTNPLFSLNTKLCITQKIPAKSQRLSALIKKYTAETELAENFEKVEKLYFEQPENSIFSWDEDITARTAEQNEFTVEYESEKITGKRQITIKDINLWFSRNSEYGSFLLQNCKEKELEQIKKILSVFAERKDALDWDGFYSFFILTVR
ncbi:MAG: AAA family ATPase [Spirochaetaceae bacterium]|nr:AAA family ATPase [Spirochaetaceae bacterium]